MSLNALRQYVETSLQAWVTAQYPSVPIKFANAPWRQPETAFFAVFVMDGKSLPADLGRVSTDRHNGMVQVDVCVPSDTGTSTAYQMIEGAGNLFRKVPVRLSDASVVKFRVPEYKDRGQFGGFYQVCMTIPYIRDELPQ